MKTWAEQLGKAQALLVMTANSSGEGTCENCGATCEVFYCGTGNECGKCFRESIEYWEHRGGFSSEAIFDSVGACRIPDENSRLYKVVMGAYYRTMTEYTDGNPHPVEVPYVEPCEECGAEMTSTGDGWIHADTPDSHKCYTAYRWSEK